MLLCATPYIQDSSSPRLTEHFRKDFLCMTSSQGVGLADNLTEDPTKAISLLRLLDAFYKSRGDPLSEAMMDDVMLHVYTKVEHCRESMAKLLSEEEDPNPIPRAA